MKFLLLEKSLEKSTHLEREVHGQHFHLVK